MEKDDFIIQNENDTCPSNLNYKLFWNLLCELFILRNSSTKLGKETIESLIKKKTLSFQAIENAIDSIIENPTYENTLDNISFLSDCSYFSITFQNEEIYHFLKSNTKIEKLCEILKNHKFSRIFFPVFVNFLISNVSSSVKFIGSVISAYDHFHYDTTYLHKIYNFFKNLNSLQSNNDHPTKCELLHALDYYLSRVKPNYDGTLISYVLIHITDPNVLIPPTYFRLFQREPYSFSGPTVDTVIPNLLPFTSISLSTPYLPYSYYESYSSLIQPMVLFMELFSKHFDEISNQVFTDKVLSLVNSGIAGKDAFVFIFLYCYHNIFLRSRIFNFFEYITSSSTSLSKFHAISIFLFSFDSVLFPSTIRVIQNRPLYSLLISNLIKLKNQFPNSPFRSKIENILSQYQGFPYIQNSYSSRAIQLAIKLYRQSLTNTNHVIDHIIQFNSNQKYRADPNAILSYMQLVLAFLSNQTEFNDQNVKFYSYIASSLICLANTDKVSYPSYLRKRIFDQLSQKVELFPLLNQMNLGLSPSLFNGAFLILSSIVKRLHCTNDLDDFGIFFSANFAFLPILLRRLCLSEVPEILRESMLFFEILGEPPLQTIQLLLNTLIKIAKTHGYRPFIRFLAPICRNKYIIDQIFLRKYDLSIVQCIDKFINSSKPEKDSVESCTQPQQDVKECLISLQQNFRNRFTEPQQESLTQPQQVMEKPTAKPQQDLDDPLTKLQHAFGYRVAKHNQDLEVPPKKSEQDPVDELLMKEIVISKSFIYFWLVFGTVPFAKQSDSYICRFIERSSIIIDSSNAETFFNSLYSVILVHGSDFAASIGQLITNQTTLCLVKHMFEKVPKSMLFEIKEKVKVNSYFQDMIDELIKANHNPDKVPSKWVRWPIDDFVYEITGILCTSP